jgi:NADH-quinone oxidoreductase subunit K
VSAYLILSAAMFAIGTYGVLARRNLIIVLMSLELMLNGVNIALVTFTLGHSATIEGAALAPHGHVFVLVVMAVAAAEVAVGLAIVISLFRTRRTIDLHDLQSLSG